MKGSNGRRAAQVSALGRSPYYVPVELLALSAGKDAWMRDVRFKCSDCGKAHVAREMECELCPACYEKAGQENAELDAS